MLSMATPSHCCLQTLVARVVQLDVLGNLAFLLPLAIVLHTVRNEAFSDNMLIREGLRVLRGRLPPGWTVSEAALESRPGAVDAAAEIVAPDGRVGAVALEARARLDPKGARDLIDATREARAHGAFVVVARYLSGSTRARLQEADVGYVDLTGNVRVILARPGLFIETQGASEDPDREERPARSLRGAKAGRIVRTLVDRKEPPGVREIAALTKIDAGYVSRVLSLLDTEALITRIGRGRIESVDWPALLRRWARDAPLESRGNARTYLEPRGLSAFVARLAVSDERYAVTGSLAAATVAPLAAPRLATVWLRDTAEAASRLALRQAEAGANVLLIEPDDEGVFEGAVKRDGVRYAATSQVAVDLLTSTGRGPAEGEELITWMRENEGAWRN